MRCDFFVAVHALVQFLAGLDLLAGAVTRAWALVVFSELLSLLQTLASALSLSLSTCSICASTVKFTLINLDR